MRRPAGSYGRRFTIALVAVAALAMGVLVSYVTSRPANPQIDGLLWPQSKPLTAFSLTDQHGRPFTLERLRGRWTLLFFGYTNCPDVCPVTLSVLKSARALMARAGTDTDALQVAFVSVDPARDTPEHLAAYVGHFDPDFLGISGSDEDLRGFARQLGVLYILAEPDASGGYLVDHTAALFLVDPRGHLVALFQAPHDAAILARDVPRIQALEWN